MRRRDEGEQTHHPRDGRLQVVKIYSKDIEKRSHS